MILNEYYDVCTVTYLVCLFSETVSRIDMDLQPVYEYHFMDWLDKFIRNEKYIQFDFKGCNDAYVILSEHRNSSVIRGSLWGLEKHIVSNTKM